jgi:hypothetical protein
MAGERPGAGRLVLLLVLTLGAAVVLGVVGRYAGRAGLLAHAGPLAEPAAELGPWVIALGAPWLAVAWVLGAVAHRVWLGALAGAVALVGGTGAWYAFTVWQLGRGALHYAVPVAFGWSLASIAAGVVFGGAGAMWANARNDWWRALGAAILAGSFIGEAIELVTIWDGRAARFVLACEFLLGAALVLVLLIRWPKALLLGIALTAIVALVAAGAEHEVRHALRHVGWHGR